MNGTVRLMSLGQTREIAATLIGIIPNLTHEEAQSLIGNKKHLVKGFKKVFDGFRAGPKRVWKTLVIGALSREEILKQLASDKYPTKVWAVDMVKDEGFCVSDHVKEIQLCLVRVNELGFLEEPNIDQIYTRAHELGLTLCPPEVGPLLWTSIEFKGRFCIAMEPISDRNGMSICGLVFAEDTMFHWLYSEPAERSVNKKWSLSSKFIFVLGDS